MTKQEFLDGLRRSLIGGLENGEINEHIRYYSDYIDSQIRMGISEEEIMSSLGEPRLIAKTLLGMENVETVTEEYVEEENSDANYRYFQNSRMVIYHFNLCRQFLCVDGGICTYDAFVTVLFYDYDGCFYVSFYKKSFSMNI